MEKITSLNYVSYLKLKELSNRTPTMVNPWFNSSYPHFCNKPLKQLSDLIPLIAYAYSWMPTIPTIRFEAIEQDEMLLSELQALQSGGGYNLYDILHKLVPVINNSIVGTSKALHFLAPNKIAIIDSRVVTAWNTYIDFDNVDFPASFTKQNINRSINSYIKYNYQMNMWRDTIKQENKNIELRDIEFLLYKLGGKK